MSARRSSLLAACLILASAVTSTPRAEAVEFGDGRLQIHGFGEIQFRAYADGYRKDRWAHSQWANIVNLEMELDLAPEGIGPFELLQAFVRVTTRYDCVYNEACSLAWSKPFQYFGKGSTRVPLNLADGLTQGRSGLLPFAPPFVSVPDPPQRVHSLEDPLTMQLPNDQSDLRSFLSVPPLDRILALGATDIEGTFGPVLDTEVALKFVEGSLNPDIFPIGPWRPNDRILSSGSLVTQDSVTIEEPLRPQTLSLYTPSKALEANLDDFDSFDQNFSQREWQWNRGASQQQTKEIKEAYLDLEMLEGRLFLRFGKQQIVWGKTELFRTTDQFNPQDLALSSLPGLEESRIALWSARGIYSFYDVGPLEDVRLELAANLDHYEPTDLGDCGEPYTVFLICGKAFGLFTHGIIGLAVAGEERPPDWWNDLHGWEVGGRMEFRWERFSFQISNFYGFSDLPVTVNFNEFERNVDPLTGRPLRAGTSGPCRRTGVDLDADGFEDAVDPSCLTPGLAANENSGNRQFMDVFNRATRGVGADFGLGDAALIDLFNNPAPLLDDMGVPQGDPFGILGDVFRASEVFSAALAGTATAGVIVNSVAQGMAVFTPLPGLAELNDTDPNNVAPPANVNSLCNRFGFSICVTGYLTVEQQALLGCGPFFGTDCDGFGGLTGNILTDPMGGPLLDQMGNPIPELIGGGVDLFNAEGSVLVQAFPQFEPGPFDPGCFVGGVRLVPCPSSVVATRFFQGGLRVLPGARTIFDAAWDPAVDGCVGSEAALQGILGAGFTLNDGGVCAGSTLLTVVDGSGQTKLFTSEMAAASNNFLSLIAAFGTAGGDPDCDPTEPFTCVFVQAIFNLFGARRPEIRAGGNGRFGRRDFLWHAGSELKLEYRKRNVLGFAMDFAEDWSKTNWGLEFTWFESESYDYTDSASGVRKADTYNLTISIDRPTFVNFLNSNRTFIFNTQWFLRYIPHYRGNGRFTTQGPFTALGTFNIFTGYYQDRLLIFATAVHDVGSASGGAIAQVIFRFTENFSTSVGMAAFYGGPGRERIALVEPAVLNNGGTHTRRGDYFNGLTAIAERDELFMTLRYTF